MRRSDELRSDRRGDSYSWVIHTEYIIMLRATPNGPMV